jgi:hypothetical protein
LESFGTTAALSGLGYSCEAGFLKKSPRFKSKARSTNDDRNSLNTPPASMPASGNPESFTNMTCETIKMSTKIMPKKRAKKRFWARRDETANFDGSAQALGGFVERSNTILDQKRAADVHDMGALLRICALDIADFRKELLVAQIKRDSLR